MNLHALLGGLVIVAVVTFGRRPIDASHTVPSGTPATCAATGAGLVCDAIAGLSAALHNPILSSRRGAILPPRETSGAVDPTVSQANIEETICRPGYSRSVRPAYAITEEIKRRLMRAQHPGERLADYELDHLIPISIGGAPLNERDLWLQPRRGQANANDKNILAYVLWHLVCEHRVPLQTAQRAISHDWTQAYSIYATPENIAKYHFRHDAGEHDELR
jgi:hypothetical protein